jgi:hypothetical protein
VHGTGSSVIHSYLSSCPNYTATSASYLDAGPFEDPLFLKLPF